VQEQGQLDTSPFCAWNGHTEVVKLLLEAKCDKGCKDKDYWAPLHFAASNGRTEVVKLLLQAGCDKECKNLDNCTPLHYAGCKVAVLMSVFSGANFAFSRFCSCFTIQISVNA